MAEVNITRQTETEAGWEFVVETSAGTEHIVGLAADYWTEVCGEAVTPEELVEASFAYLLEQEPASAILSEFNLQDIETYFPTYPEEIEDYINE